MAFPVEQDATSKQDKLQGGGHYAAPRQQSQASSRGVDPQFAYLCVTGDFVFDCFRVFHAVASTGCWWPTKHTNTEYTAPKINALVGTSDSFPAGQWSVTVSLVCQSANTPHRSWYLVSLTTDPTRSPKSKIGLHHGSYSLQQNTYMEDLFLVLEEA